MSADLAGWLQVSLEAVGLVLTIWSGKTIQRRRRRRVRYSRFSAWGIERTRFEITDDSQS